MKNSKRQRSSSLFEKKSVRKVDLSPSSESSQSSDSSVDDTIGHFNPKLGGHCRIRGRYIVWRELGTGTFGKVYECEGILSNFLQMANGIHYCFRLK